MNFYSLIARRVAENPSALCLQVGDRRLDRAWLHAQSARYANALVSLGCAAGARVAVQVEKSPEALALYLGILRAGLCYMPLNTAYKPAEMTHFLQDAAPALMIGGQDHGLHPRFYHFDAKGEGGFGDLAAAQSPAFDDRATDREAIGALLYTSGTTGKPKGAMLSHRAMSYAAQGLGAIWAITEQDVLLHALPMFHGHGLFISSNVALVAGAAMIFQPKFDLEAVIEALPRASVFMGVPTFYHRLLADPRLTPDLCRNLRLFVSGSAPMTAETHRAFRRATGAEIVERYGATEAMIICSNPLHGEKRAGAVGFPLPGVDLRIAGPDDRPVPQGEIGMIQMKGDGLFTGYLNLPEKTAEEFTADGYFRTGDLGSLSPDGYVTITGRVKDLIITGGYNVYPVEVETVIDALKGVQESAVVGLPHPDFGEAVTAFVVLKAEVTSPEAILAACKAALANYKVPKDVRIVAALPRNVMGKVQKALLRQQG